MPYNEHVVVLKPRDSSKKSKRTRGSCGISVCGAEVPENASVFWNLEDNHGEPYEIRFPTNEWSEAEARVWLSENRIKYATFGAADKTPESCCDFVNKSDDLLEIDIHGFVGDEFEDNDSRSFRNRLKEAGNPKEIKVNINSHGGFHFDGVSINNALRNHPAKVTTEVSGVAASAAATIFAAGEERLAPSNTTLMLHKPAIQMMFGANAVKMRKQADALDVLQEGIVKTFSGVMNKSDSEINEMLNDETWLTAEGALKTGLVTSVTDEVDIVDFHDFNDKRLNYSNVPESVLNVFDVNHGDTELDIDIEHPSSLYEKLCSYIDKTFNNHTSLTPKKEPEDMALTKEVQDAIDAAVAGVNTKLEAVSAVNATLKTELASSSAVVAQLTTAMSNQAQATQDDEHTRFCTDLVNQGRMYPKDVKAHSATLAQKHKTDEAKFTADNQECPDYDFFKDFLSSLPVVVPVDERPVSNKDGKGSLGSTSEKDVAKAIDKIITDAKTSGKEISLADATIQYSKENAAVDMAGIPEI